MELKVDIAFEDLMQAIQHLPEDQLSALRSALSQPPTDKFKDAEDFKQFLLKGPVMSDDQYRVYRDNRNRFNGWRSK